MHLYENSARIIVVSSSNPSHSIYSKQNKTFQTSLTTELHTSDALPPNERNNGETYLLANKVEVLHELNECTNYRDMYTRSTVQQM